MSFRLCSLPHSELDMRYIRADWGVSGDDPGVALYEIDRTGLVHRHAELTLDGARFAPEEVLLMHPLDVDTMLVHPHVEQLSKHDFEQLWDDLAPRRSLWDTVPDPTTAWVAQPASEMHLGWFPQGAPSDDWTLVPGFRCLWFWGPEASVARAQRTIFLSPSVEWTAAVRTAA